MSTVHFAQNLGEFMNKFQLRPSVAFVPIKEDVFDFFQSNTRRSFRYRIAPDLVSLIKKLDGNHEVSETSAREHDFLSFLHGKCLVENLEDTVLYAQSPWRRTLNFIADFFPSNQVMSNFSKLQSTYIIVLGLGAVGGWVARQLAASGFEKMVLIDADKIEASNLNRSLYTDLDIGKFKIDALAEKLIALNSSMIIHKKYLNVDSAESLQEIISYVPGDVIFVNCADMPSVDDTSSWVNLACQMSKTPYVIAGGYNLHLSLVGMTVIPGETACYQCGRITLDEVQSQELLELKRLNRPWRNIGSLGPLVAITSSFTVNEVIRLALASPGRLLPVMLNRRGEFNFQTNKLHFIDLPRRKECLCMTQDATSNQEILNT